MSNKLIHDFIKNQFLGLKSRKTFVIKEYKFLTI